MKELSSGARALLEQYREDSEIQDQPDAAVLERIESSIDGRGASSTQTPRRAAGWVVLGALAAAAVAMLWVWTSQTELRVMAPTPVSAAVDRVAEQAERLPQVPRPPVPRAPRVVSPTPPPTEPSPASTPPQRGRGQAVEPTRSAEPDDGLRRELELLRRARHALRQGRLAGAKEALRAHARSYAKGQLAEEREALLVVVRCTDGDVNTGRAAFKAAYPSSHHLPSIRVACVSQKKSRAVTDGPDGGQ